ncbi:MAG: hypothetical protein A2315_08620 [Ignavibacteria bacterium RIFOXYB2_FULL_35_12]|nr:MAG: hypothetical protein A2006_09785 [Ignavibacteria bacterium GWC2_35_8]OGU59752.1 MAG: hypothetical protein A2X60_10340 [Ignavibacteria bacterium GWF2_35_20]OGU80652.1 MAG: hypothetical protein A2254_13520 [Ignavibacteria bacterium RIFOXYA2_FULL_35_9]OGU85220.1 MAG: hypothetical protein A3K31_11800 [Ignavibacteria bacterium RIFOXYA12_FULL_35_25]OGU91769.1 MAG: hypothetical protein A2492_07310 [Ignavibacteria bacterium RIFOXYC12_FULL_35_11]OGU97427.1 MAG: hypothetical protein A2347_15240 
MSAAIADKTTIILRDFYFGEKNGYVNHNKFLNIVIILCKQIKIVMRELTIFTQTIDLLEG